MNESFLRRARSLIPKRLRTAFSSHGVKQPFSEFSASDIRYENGFGFQGLYHPYLEALKANDLHEAELLLHDFYISHGKWLNGLGSERQALAVQAWKKDPHELMQQIGEKGYRSGQFERGTLDPGSRAREKAGHLYDTKRSIEEYGFDETRFGSGLKGVLLEDKVLLLGGQHRASILYFMGEDRFKVKISNHGKIPRNLKLEGDLSCLAVVAEGIVPSGDARKVLQRIYAGLSQEEARARGYPFHE